MNRTELLFYRVSRAQQEPFNLPSSFGFLVTFTNRSKDVRGPKKRRKEVRVQAVRKIETTPLISARIRNFLCHFSIFEMKFTKSKMGRPW